MKSRRRMKKDECYQLEQLTKDRRIKNRYKHPDYRSRICKSAWLTADSSDEESITVVVGYTTTYSVDVLVDNSEGWSWLKTNQYTLPNQMRGFRKLYPAPDQCRRGSSLAG